MSQPKGRIMAVIGYLRVSTGEQSIGAQRHSIEQTHKVETWFADEGVSGAVKALQRPVRIPAKLNSHSGQREHPDP
ncbi:recombinase family protein [Aeromonas sobria]|uniref:recombinase family protein n=1 Tax=Aeromonas sobria TaxID=646 RepID=UPI0020A4CF96|nr:recombinase family protein [Aeromonas sobria]